MLIEHPLCYTTTMKNLRFSLGILIFLVGIGLVGHILHGSVFYDGSEDTGRIETTTTDDTSRGTIQHIIQSMTGSPTNTSKPKPVAKKQLAPKDPETLVIPDINVNASIEQIGLTSKGNVGTPTAFKDAAWYKLGTRPGEVGSAIIDGHVDNGLGLAGVFKNLHKLTPGDDVYVVQHDGTKLHFRVEKVETYPYNVIPTSDIFQSSDGARLNLITCEGEWIKDQKTYNARLVVYTTLVS